MTPTVSAYQARCRSIQTSEKISAATTTKISTIPCDTHAAAIITEVQTRYLPVRRPADSRPSARMPSDERDRERELARHRRFQVAAVDAEALVQRERQPAEGEHLRDRMTEVPEPPERPAGGRQRDQAEHAHELHRDAVRQHGVDEEDRERRQHHVEAVRGHTAVPVHRPAVQPERAEQVVAHVGGAPHVGAEVAAGRGRVVEDQIRARDGAD